MKKLFKKSTNPETIKQKAWLNLVLFLVTLLVNYLSGSGIMGRSQASVSAENPTLITPAGYAFSIWGLIYLLLLVALGFNAYQPMQKKHLHFNQKNSLAFSATCILNIAWTFAFLFKLYSLSAILILALAVILAYLLDQVIRHHQSLWLRLSFAFYGGWVLIASVINVAVVILAKRGAAEFKSEALIAIITLVVATALGAFISLRIKCPFYMLPLLWAYIAIFFRQENKGVKVAALALSFVIFAFLLWRLIERRSEFKLKHRRKDA